MFIRFDTNHERDRQTDRPTPVQHTSFYTTDIKRCCHHEEPFTSLSQLTYQMSTSLTISRSRGQRSRSHGLTKLKDGMNCNRRAYCHTVFKVGGTKNKLHKKVNRWHNLWFAEFVPFWDNRVTSQLSSPTQLSAPFAINAIC